MYRDPSGLLPPKYHHDITYSAALAVLGDHNDAGFLANDDMAQDDNHGVGEWVDFLAGTGEGWQKGVHISLLPQV